MSLNSGEQLVFDHLQNHPEERQHWMGKVQSAVTAAGKDPLSAAGLLEPELWRYFEERARTVAEFRESARRIGLQRTSMRNLAELLVRLWGPPVPARPKARTREG